MVSYPQKIRNVSKLFDAKTDLIYYFSLSLYKEICYSDQILLYTQAAKVGQGGDRSPRNPKSLQKIGLYHNRF